VLQNIFVGSYLCVNIYLNQIFLDCLAILSGTWYKCDVCDHLHGCYLSELAILFSKYEGFWGVRKN